MKGPFAHWKHIHRFQPGNDADRSTLTDDIEFRLPVGWLGNVIGGPFVRRKLERTFRYRHAMTKMDLERRAEEPSGNGGALTILITGATGMVGTALEAFLRMQGHRVRRVTWNPKRPTDVRWDIHASEMDLSSDEKLDAVVHLAGENIASGRW